MKNVWMGLDDNAGHTIQIYQSTGDEFFGTFGEILFRATSYKRYLIQAANVKVRLTSRAKSGGYTR